ncbi:MAG: winged helix-turn-helix transcriptional regulator [Euryarchaeota archaeon]|nr:winged helix-turn-helix transcriptional regulator [Euryarchaeota archaeon]
MVTVPVGRIGDEAVYDWSWKHGDPWESVTRNNLGDPYPRPGAPQMGSGRYAFKLNDTLRVKDAVGQWQEVVRILRNQTESPDYAARGEGPRDFRWVTFYVNLSTRQPVRADFRSEAANEFPIPGAYSQTNVRWNRPDLNLSVLAFQGRTFRLGDDLGNAAWIGGAKAWDEYGAYSDQEVRLNYRTYRAHVADQARIDGRLSLAIRIEAKVMAEISWLGESSFASTDETITRTYWLADGVPYPIRIESEVRYDRTNDPDHDYKRYHENGFQETKILRELRAGTHPILWQTPLPSSAPTVNAAMERSGAEARAPADGTGFRSQYPLSEAIAAVEQDQGMVGFRQWRTQNPDSALVGFYYEFGAHRAFCMLLDTTSHRTASWMFAYMSRNGQGYVVATNKDPTAGTVQNTDFGRARFWTPNLTDVNPFPQLPANPITIAAAEKEWDGLNLRQASPAGGPNRISWGYYAACGVGPPYGDRIEWTQKRAYIDPDEQRLNRIFVDQFTGMEAQAAQGYDRTGLFINVTSGAMMGLIGESFETDKYEMPQAFIGKLTGPGGPGPASPRDQSISGVPLAAAVTGTLLGIFLVAYFYPLVKFAGAQTMALLPGYAKLEKGELLNNKIREGLVQLIKADPGITPPELQAHLQVGWTTIVYHLHVLERNKLVSSLIDGRHKRFFPVGEINHGKRGLIAALKNSRTKQLYEHILGQPGVIQKELVAGLGVSLPSTLWHIERLEKAGLVGHDKHGRKVHYYANPIESLVDRYDPTSAVEVV